MGLEIGTWIAHFCWALSSAPKRRDNAPLVCSSLLSMRDGKVHTHYMYSFCGRCYPAVGTTLKGGPMEPKLEDPVERFCKEFDGNKGGSGDAKRKAGFFIM
jgi:hypothetical protein